MTDDIPTSMAEAMDHCWRCGRPVTLAWCLRHGSTGELLEVCCKSCRWWDAAAGLREDHNVARRRIKRRSA